MKQQIKNMNKMEQLRSILLLLLTLQVKGQIETCQIINLNEYVSILTVWQSNISPIKIAFTITGGPLPLDCIDEKGAICKCYQEGCLIDNPRSLKSVIQLANIGVSLTVNGRNCSTVIFSDFIILETGKVRVLSRDKQKARFSKNSKCWDKDTLIECTVGTDLTYIDFQVDQANSIIRITEIMMLNKEEIFQNLFQVSQKKENITKSPRQLQSFTNQTLTRVQAMVVPSNFISNAINIYTFTFIPQTFEKFLQIRVTPPPTIRIPATLVCKGLSGFDNSSLICSVNLLSRVITITNGFTNTLIMPSNISFNIASLQNPVDTSVTTASFILETFSRLGEIPHDNISTSLFIGFNCTSPCQQCSTAANQCLSCYGMATNKYLVDSQCQASCPSSQYADSLNICQQCQSQCATCNNSASQCLTCQTGYSLVGSVCYNSSLYFSQYYFYCSGISFAMCIFVLLIKCCSCKTKLIQSFIAMIAVPEMVGWVFLVYLYVNEASFFHIMIVSAAAGMHIILNIIYGFTHQKMIIHQSGAKYKQLILDNHCWNTFSIVLSFLVSFKFHLIQMSNLGESEALSGVWSPDVWGVWNMISITYIISCYTIFMGSSAYFVLNNMSRSNEWIWKATIDVAALSTFMMILLIISACQNGRGEQIPADLEAPKKNPYYNKVEDSNSAFIDNAIQKIPKIKEIPVQTLKPLEKTGFTRRPYTYMDNDRSFTEEDVLPQKKSAAAPPLKKKDLSQTQPDQNSAYSEPNSTRRQQKQPAPTILKQPVIPVAPIEKPVQQAQQKDHRAEMQLLKSYIDFMKQEKMLLKDERHGMMKERKRIQEVEMERQLDFMNMQLQLNKNQELLSQERQQLETIRKQFIDEMDNRVRQRMEDWEVNSVVSKKKVISPRPPSPSRVKPTEQSQQYTYSYSPEVSLHDKQLQTELNKSQKRDMKVQVGNQTKEKTLMTSFQQQTSNLAINKLSIEEIPSQEEATDQDKSKPAKRYDAEQQISAFTEESPQIVDDPIVGNKAAHGLISKQSEINQSQKSQVANPILGNNAVKSLIIKESETNQSKKSLESLAQVTNPIAGNNAAKGQIVKQIENNESQKSLVIGPIINNKPLTAYLEQDVRYKSFMEETKKSLVTSQSSLPISQITPVRGNEAVYRNVTGMTELDNSESLVELISGNKPLYQQITPRQLLLHSVNESMLEKIQDNAPVKKYMSKTGNVSDREANQSQIEPINDNIAYYQDAPPFDQIQNELNESLIEPVKENQAYFNAASKMDKYSNNPNERNESMIEPIVDNRPFYNEVENMREEQQREMDQSQLEPHPENKACYNQVDVEANLEQEQETDERQSKCSGSVTEEITSIKPVFEALAPQFPSKEDNEMHPTVLLQQNDSPQQEEEKEADPKPLATKIKKILYSDKSESSIDEMMEDTPSNYNIPNGRLDGRTLDMKKLQAKERVRGNAKQLESGNYLQKTLQPQQSELLSNKQGQPVKDGHQYFSPAKKQEQSIKLENESPGKVNNLFMQDGPPTVSNTRNSKQLASNGSIHQNIWVPQQKSAVRQRNEGYQIEPNDILQTFGQEVDDQQPDEDGQVMTMGLTGDEGFKKNNKKRTIRNKSFKDDESSAIDNINPYAIKTLVPVVNNKPLKLKK